MTNNDILRRIRYSFDLDDSQVIQLFSLGNLEVTRAQMSDWLKKDDDEAFVPCKDVELAAFLNGLIVEKRGPKEGPAHENEQKLNNNQVFTKLKIALSLQADEVLELLAAGGLTLSKHELSAFFRKPGHKHWRQCKDQCLRSFLKGVQAKYRQ
ncbi:MAG TPA: DUF1456 family protein [Xanthomonadales bacterium]|nr:DUF1456 family protein [Xanthomonadales bacterium]